MLDGLACNFGNELLLGIGGFLASCGFAQSIAMFFVLLVTKNKSEKRAICYLQGIFFTGMMIGLLLIYLSSRGTL